MRKQFLLLFVALFVLVTPFQVNAVEEPKKIDLNAPPGSFRTTCPSCWIVIEPKPVCLRCVCFNSKGGQNESCQPIEMFSNCKDIINDNGKPACKR